MQVLWEQKGEVDDKCKDRFFFFFFPPPQKTPANNAARKVMDRGVS